MFENPRRGGQARNFTTKYCSENSSSQIVFRTDTFLKIVVGCPCVVFVSSHTKGKQSRSVDVYIKVGTWMVCLLKRKKKKHCDFLFPVTGLTPCSLLGGNENL